MKTNKHLWSCHVQLFLGWIMFQKNVVKEINLQSVSDRVDLSVYIAKAFLHNSWKGEGRTPLTVYRPVDKSGCCKKKTPRTRSVIFKRRRKVHKNGVISSNFLSEISSHILQRGVNTISSNKTNRYSKQTVLTRAVWDATHTATDIKLIAYL